jgi:tetratricopeptide (TPR) repeat protein
MTVKNTNSLCHQCVAYTLIFSVLIAMTTVSFAKEALQKGSEVVNKPVLNEEIKRFQLLIQEHPQQLEYYNNLAVLYARKGNLKLAEQTLKQGLNAKAEVAILYNNLSTVYFELSREDYASALRLDIEPGKVSLLTVAPAPSKAKQKHTTHITNSNQSFISSHETVSPSTTEITEQEQIANTILGWASAWSAQEVDLYLSFYSKNFTPPGSQSRTHWAQARKKRLTLPRWVTVNVSELSFKPTTSQKASVIFNQDYRSSRYSDQSKKELVLEYIDGAWLIVKENSL